MKYCFRNNNINALHKRLIHIWLFCFLLRIIDTEVKKLYKIIVYGQMVPIVEYIQLFSQRATIKSKHQALTFYFDKQLTMFGN